jgi:hypothetical protein
MKRHTCARGLLVGAMSVIALGASTGVAQAQPELPEPNPQPAPGIVDLFLTTPDLFVDPRDEGGPGSDSDRVGMYCENLFVRCR